MKIEPRTKTAAKPRTNSAAPSTMRPRERCSSAVSLSPVT